MFHSQDRTVSFVLLDHLLLLEKFIAMSLKAFKISFLG